MSENQGLKPEQLKAINHEGSDILVSASAGSGKTFVMIKRLIRLITEGKAHVEEILAATFTEAAAADMKSKLKRALSEEIENGNVKLASELNKVENADICTLHSFCSRLIRAYFFAAGVSPDYKIADESEAFALKKESLDETFSAFYAEKNAEFLALIDKYRARRKDESLKKVITEIYDFCDSEPYPDKLLSAFRENFTASGAARLEEKFSERVKAAAGTLLNGISTLKSDCEQAGYKAGAEQAAVFSDIAAKIQCGGAAFARETAERNDLPPITRQKPPEGFENLKERLKTAKSEIKSLCDFSAGAKIDENDLAGLSACGEILKEVCERFTEIYSRKKRESNLLDFSDLEKFALKTLKDEKVNAAVRKKYKYVFVDEYQDINGVQEEIISAITDGNLFMVGDVKQSIYGFRGCRSEIFERKEKTVEEKGGVAAGLNYNFRSAENVIEFINEVFDFCYVPFVTGLDYKSEARLIGGGIYPDDAKGRAKLHFLVKEKKEKAERVPPHVYDILEEAKKEEEKDAAAVSNLLADIIDKELTQDFYDVKAKAFRRVKTGDIAILTRAGDSAYVKGIVEGLSGHGIRVVSGVMQNVCDFPEIKTLINVLKLIDCFYDDAPLVCTLLSPVGGFTEEELADVALFYSEKDNKDEKSHAGFCDAFCYYIDRADTPLKTRLAEFKKYFDKMRRLADFKGAKGILDKIISDSGYENFLLAEKDGDEKVRRLYRFLSETVSGGRVLSVAEFLRRTELSPKAFEFEGGGEEDAVKVTTIHSSKGLEFPVVIVCGLEKPFSCKDETKLVLCDREEGFFPYSFDDVNRTVKTNGFREIVKSKARETQVKEEMRLFYVALTRAAYSLHLVFEKSADTRSDVFAPVFTSGGSFLDFVPACIPAETHFSTKFGLSGVKRRGREILVAKPDEIATKKMARDFAFSYPHLYATRLPLKNSVSAAVRNNAQEFYPVYSLFAENGGTDAERGTIAHRIMEHYDFNGEFYSQLSVMKEKNYVTEEELLKIDTERLKHAIEGGAFENVKGKTLFREQPFTVNIPASRLFDTDEDEQVLLQGVIDLMAVSGDTAEIIDYKYSVLDAESLKKKYFEQLELYAYAAEKVLGVKVASKTLVNIFTGETVRL